METLQAGVYGQDRLEKLARNHPESPLAKPYHLLTELKKRIALLGPADLQNMGISPEDHKKYLQSEIAINYDPSGRIKNCSVTRNNQTREYTVNLSQGYLNAVTRDMLQQTDLSHEMGHVLDSIDSRNISLLERNRDILTLIGIGSAVISGLGVVGVAGMALTPAIATGAALASGLAIASNMAAAQRSLSAEHFADAFSDKINPEFSMARNIREGWSKEGGMDSKVNWFAESIGPVGRLIFYTALHVTGMGTAHPTYAERIKKSDTRTNTRPTTQAL